MFHHAFRHKFRLVTACVLMALGSALLVHAIEAASAQRIYLRVKYGFFRGLSREVPRLRSNRLAEAAELAQKAMRSYGDNYYLPTYIAQLAVMRAERARSSDELADALRFALFHSNEAYCLNPYNAEIRTVRAKSLELSGDTDGALAVWREAVSREPWNPRVRTEFAECLLRSGTASNLAEAVAQRAFVTDAALRNRLNKLAALVGRAP